jgi:hypothetical protein
LLTARGRRRRKAQRLQCGAQIRHREQLQGEFNKLDEISCSTAVQPGLTLARCTQRSSD